MLLIRFVVKKKHKTAYIALLTLKRNFTHSISSLSNQVRKQLSSICLRQPLMRGEEQNREEEEMAQKKLGGGRNRGKKQGGGRKWEVNVQGGGRNWLRKQGEGRFTSLFPPLTFVYEILGKCYSMSIIITEEKKFCTKRFQ